ncbi:unnamed protein product [Closterium sp. NIES-64]|nr:unnamed protein product [Closterium sp. NIES-64]
MSLNCSSLAWTQTLSNDVQDSLEGLYGAPKLPKHPSFSIRKSTVLATLDFVKALGDISFGLVDVFPNEDRQTALGEGCYRVVRLLEDEAVLMSSRDRVPFMLLLEVLNCLPLSARKAGTAPEGMAPAKTGIPLAASQPLPMRPPPWALHMWSHARPASQHAQDAPLGLSRTLSDVALDRAMASMYSRMRLVQLSLEVCKRPPAPAAAAAAAVAAAATATADATATAPAAGVRTDILSQVQQAVAAGAALAGARSKPNLSPSVPSVASNTDTEKGGDAEQAEWEEYVSVRLVAVPGVTLDDLTGLDAVSLSRGRARVPSSLAIAHVRAVTHQGEGPPPGMPVTSPSSGVGPAQELLERQRVDESWESRKARIRQSSKFGTSPDWDLRNEARFLWKRIPASVKDGNAELAATWRVGQAMWKRDSQDVYDALKAFHWSPIVRPMVAALTDRYTHTMMELVARSFSTISPSHAATFLGLTSQEALAFLEARDWKYDSATDMFTPPVVQAGKDKELEEEQRQLAQVKRLTEYVFNLEH